MQEKSIKPLHELMSGDLALISGANCVLARLWRLLLFQLNVRAPIWEILLTNYTADCKDCMGEEKALNLKGNITKKLAKDELSWVRFCQGVSVFGFEETIFKMTLVDGTDQAGFTTKVVQIRLPLVRDDEDGAAGTALRVLWDMTNKAFPDRLDHWTAYMGRYLKRYKKATGGNTKFLKGNITRALCDNQITWATAYRGLIIHDYSKVTMELIVKQKGHSEYQSVQLELKRK